MPKSKQELKRERRLARKHLQTSNSKAVVGAAPYLHKERVTLTGIQTLKGGSNGGTFYTMVNGNGCQT